MTLGVTISAVTLQGNGITTSFVYPFDIPNAADAVITYTDTSGVQTILATTQYTITGIGLAGGGTVTYPLAGSPIATGTLLTIQRIVPLVQTMSVRAQGPTFQAIETEDDYQVMIDQQQQFELDRTLQLNVADINPMPQLPPASVRAGLWLFFDSHGNPTVASAITGSVAVSAAMIPVVEAASTLAAAGAMGVIPNLANIAALRAMTAVVNCVFVEGYYALADGGEGVFVLGGASSDNGGTIINAANGFSYYRAANGNSLTIRQFGAKGDGVTDDTTAIQTAATVAQQSSVKLIIPRGQFVVSNTISGTAPITIEGVNPGIGPGITNDTNCSQILCKGTFTAGDVFSWVTYDSCIFRDFQIAGATGLAYNSACPRISGAGIHISAPNPGVSTNFGSVIDHVAFSGIYQPIQLTLCGENTLTRNNYCQAWGNTSQAFYADNANTSVESSCGQVTENIFFGNPSSTQAACAEIHCGYGAIRANKFLGAQIGLKVEADQPVNIGSVIIKDNSFEENSVQSILVTQSGSHVIASVQIGWNQFSNIAQTGIQAHIVILPQGGGSAADMYDIDIGDNNFNSNITGSPGAFIVVNGSNVTVHDNHGTIFGGTCYGVIVNASSGRTAVLDNAWVANGGALTNTNGYFLSSSTLIRDLSTAAGFTAATLPTNGAAGSEIYVTDGKATNFGGANLVVTNGGSGCVAWRMGGGWLTIET